MKYIIVDWCNNRMFPENNFNSFDEGWEFIYKNVDNSLFEQSQNDNDNVFQDIFVVPEH